AAHREAALAAQRAEEDRIAAELERASAKRQKDEQDAVIASELAEAVQARKEAEESRIEAQRLQSELQVALEGASEAYSSAAKSMAAATEKLRDAEIQHAAAVAARGKAEADQRDLDERLELHERQLALLARASNDDAELELRRTDEGFTMEPSAMTEAERGAYASQWPPALVVIARSLAVALERARDFTRKLRERLDAIVDRERIAASREAQLEKDRAELRAQRAVHEEAVRELEQSRSQLQVEQAIADRNATEAAAALRSARQEAAAAKAASHDQFVWTAAMEDLEDLAEDVMITPA